MISLNNYFMKPNYDILTETNIDRLFDIFEKELSNIDDNPNFDQIFRNFNEENNIMINFKQTKDKYLNQVKGNSKESINDDKQKYHIINIEVPINVVDEDRTNKQMIRTILHELIHILNDEKIPNFITNKKTNKFSTMEERFNTRNTLNPHTYNFNEINIEDMKKYLDYVTHIREKANFAFTIALSCYFDMNNKSPEEIFNDNFEKIKYYESGQIDTKTFNNYLLQQKLDSIELFTMQYAMFYVGQKQYINQIYSILRLSVKYWKRLNKILGEPYVK